jgi:DNA-binding transcriptional regulator YdaS (Cro superfamily)
MNLKSYLRTLKICEREPFASRCGCSLQHLRFVAYGAKRCSETLALAIERETGGQVTVAELRPQFAHDLKRSGYVRQPDKSPQAAA